MVYRRGENKFTEAVQEQINDYSQNPRMATSNKTDYEDKMNDTDCQGQQQPTALHTPQIPSSPPGGKPPRTKTGRLIQPNNLLKVLTANV